MDELLERALEEIAGPVLLLDGELRIVAASTGARALLGEIPPLARAPAILCGHSEHRPIAEALARGERASGEVRRVTPSGERRLGVKVVPLEGGALLFLEELGEAPRQPVLRHGIWYQSESMSALLEQVERVARSDASVLIRGETGSGKELVARALHDASPRSKGPFVALNCAAFPSQLLESELFGHVRGSFTGAIRDRDGHFRAASGGTLFLDEVAELPLELQAKLLRVLQERAVVPVGTTEAIPVDVRIVSATHRALRTEVDEGRFRADLMYRLRVVPIYLPPLRERGDDVVLLAQRFVQENNARSTGRQVLRMSPGVLRALRDYGWPGNVRELANVIEYAFLLGDGPVLTESELPPDLGGRPVADGAESDEVGAGEAGSEEARRLRRALERARGNRQLAAASLGMSRATLWRKMKTHGITE